MVFELRSVRVGTVGVLDGDGGVGAPDARLHQRGNGLSALQRGRAVGGSRVEAEPQALFV